MSQNSLISIAYKALDCREKGLFSPDSPVELEIHYREGIWVEPKLSGSKLFVYKDLEEAKRAYGRVLDHQVWEVQAENLIKAEFMAKSFDSIHIKNFWQIERDFPSYSVFRGVHFCDKLKLVRRIS